MADEINLRTIKRTDKDVEAIVDCTSQVAVYQYCPSTNEWQKLEMEGALFVFARHTGATAKGSNGRTARPSRFGFIILNRVATTNMVEDLNGCLELSMECPYLLYKNATGGIYCIWFYSSDDCNKIHQTIRDLLDRPEKAYPPPQRPNVPVTVASNGTPDVMEMLIKGLKRNGISKGSAAITTSAFNTPNNKQQPPQPVHSLHILDSSIIQHTPPHNSTTNGSQPTKRIDVQELFSSASKSQGASGGVPTHSLDSHLVTQAAENTTPQRPTQNGIGRINGNGQQQHPRSGSGRPKQGKSGSPPTLTNQPRNQTTHSSQLDGFSISRPTPDGHRAHEGSGRRKSVTDTGSLGPQAGQPATPLSMQQLKTTLIQLLKNDADFLHTIHSAYLDTYQRPK